MKRTRLLLAGTLVVVAGCGLTSGSPWSTTSAPARSAAANP